MKCKYCDAELLEGNLVCPSCGKVQEEISEEIEPAAETAENLEMEEIAEVAQIAETPETAESAEPEKAEESKKSNPGKTALMVALIVVVLAVLVALVVGGMEKPAVEAPTDATAPVETQEPTIPADGNPDDETCKGSYTVTDEALLAAGDRVVATAGDAKLTVGQLQIYYWEEVYNVVNQYGEWCSMLGLNVNQSLDTQINPQSEAGLTWQQYFLGAALNNWHAYQSLSLASKESDFQPEEDYLEYLAQLPETLEKSAIENGYANADELVADMAGPGVSVADYLEYITLYNEGYMFFEHEYDKIQPAAEEVGDYFMAHEAEYAEGGVTRDSGKYVDVRHILLVPNDPNSTTGEDGYPVYSEEAWDACLVEAEKIYDEWKAGDLSEESFAEYAKQYSSDGSAVDGGLYTNVTKGQMVKNFEDWCFDDARQVGDHGLVKTQYGYHIMFFSGSRDIWYVQAEYDYISEKAAELLPAVTEKYPMTVDYSAIVLGHRDLGA